jgi:hypothetical protein
MNGEWGLGRDLMVYTIAMCCAGEYFLLMTQMVEGSKIVQVDTRIVFSQVKRTVWILKFLLLS